MKATKQARRDATQLYRDCLVNGLLDEARARQVVQQIVSTKPRGFLGMLGYFRRLVILDRARHAAKIESAVALPTDLQTNLQETLTRAYGPGMATTFSQNPTLIGGIRIQVGSDVYDGSVRGRLAVLEQSF